MKPARLSISPITQVPCRAKCKRYDTRFMLIMCLACLLSLPGCAFLLPRASETAKSPWKSYNDVKAAYEKIIPGKTTAQELKTLGFNPDVTPNIRILNYLDVAKAVQPIRMDDLDEGLATCLKAKDNCVAYEFELKNIKRKRYGNFLLDLLNFKRKTNAAGWRFKTFIVVVKDVAVYKVWGGDPKIEETTEVKNPLGPLQDGSNLLLLRP